MDSPKPMETNHFGIRHLGLMALFLAAIYHPVLDPRRVFSGMDFLNLLYPQAILVKQAYGQGVFPLWNWYTWGGSPLLAAMQSAPLYPPMWFALLLPLPFCLHIFIYLHLLWAALGASVAARKVFRTPPLASVFAGTVYAGGGFFLGHVEQANSIAAISWVPWIVGLALDLRLPGSRILGLAAAVAMALLAGHPQYAVLALLFCGLFLTLLVVPEGGKKSFLVLARFTLAVAFGGAFSAAQILPTQELATLSERVWPYDDPAAPALKWSYLAGIGVPGFFNRLADSPGPPLGYTELGLYAGLAACVFFVVGTAAIVRRRCRIGFVLLGVWSVAVLYALGRDGFVAPMVFRVVGYLAHSRGAARSLSIASLLFAIVAARGVAALLCGWTPLSSRPRLATALGLILCTCCAVDLAITHWAELEMRLVRSKVLDLPIPSESRLADATGKAGRLYRFMSRDSDLYLDPTGDAVYQRRYRMQPNLNLPDGIPVLDGYEEGLLPPRHYANFLRRHNRNLRSGEPDAALLAMMGCGRMFTEYPLPGKVPEWVQDGPAGYFFGVTYRVWRSVFQPAWAVDLQTLGPAAGVRLDPEWWGATLRRTSDGIPGREPTLAGAVPRTHPASSLTTQTFSAASRAASVRVAEIHPNAMVLESANAAGRDLLFFQSWYPGWSVSPDMRRGVPSPLKPWSPVSSVFRWPESQRAVLRFTPYSFRLGGFVTLLTMAFWAFRVRFPRRLKES